MSKIYKGKLKFYKRACGFGYLEYIEGGEKKSIYTHVSQFVGGVQSVKVEELYKFKIGKNERGLIATEVEVLYAKVKTNTGTNREKKI